MLQATVEQFSYTLTLIADNRQLICSSFSDIRIRHVCSLLACQTALMVCK